MSIYRPVRQREREVSFTGGLHAIFRDTIRQGGGGEFPRQRQGGRKQSTSTTRLQLVTSFEIPVEKAKGVLMIRPGLQFLLTAENGGRREESRRDSAGRFDFGMTCDIEDDIEMDLDCFYSGIGRSERGSFGAGFNLRMEFQTASLEACQALIRMRIGGLQCRVAVLAGTIRGGERTRIKAISSFPGHFAEMVSHELA